MPDRTVPSSLELARRDVIVVAPSAVHDDIRARFAPETRVVLFDDRDVTDAVAHVLEHHPDIVAVEAGVITTIRGRMLINTLLGDEDLAGCEVRVIPERRDGISEPFDLDPACRRAEGRMRLPHVEAQVDGNDVALVGLSAAGLQVLAPTLLRPNQRVRVTLRTPDEDLVRAEALVVWAAYEMPKGQPARFRAGLEVGAGTSGYAAFVARARASAPA